MKTHRRFFLSFLASCVLAVAAFAAEGSPAGVWKWTVQGRQGQGFEQELKLDLQGRQLTGVMIGRQGVPDTPIAEATFKDGQVHFTITREFNGNKFTTKYDGKLDGDTITGVFERSGLASGPTKSEWHAKRVK